jgi:hypothetical protein
VLGSFTCPKFGTWGRLFNFPYERRQADDYIGANKLYCIMRDITVNVSKFLHKTGSIGKI